MVGGGRQHAGVSFFVTVMMAWSCGFCSIGLGQEGALPVTTDMHAHGLNEQQLDSLAGVFDRASGRDRFPRGIWVRRY